jgi:hypothetical protein
MWQFWGELSLFKIIIIIKTIIMKAFATSQGIRIKDKIFHNITVRKISINEYKTLKQYMKVSDESGHCYIYFSKKNKEVMIAHLNQDHSFGEIELYKAIS